MKQRPTGRHGGTAAPSDRRGPVCSVVFGEHPDPATLATDAAGGTSFADLHLDQIIAAATSGRREYDLAPLFRTRLADPDAVAFRQAVMRDLDDASLREAIAGFATGMRRARRFLARAAKRSSARERQVWSVYGMRAYVGAVTALAGGLRSATLHSTGLGRLQDHVAAYVEDAAFADLDARTARVLRDLDDIRFCLHIDGPSVTVTTCDDTSDYSREVAQTFARFRDDPTGQTPDPPERSTGLDDLEIAVLDRIAELHPDVFAALERVADRREDHVDETIAAFDREVQFYLAYLELIEPMRKGGLPFAYPEVTADSGQLDVRETFDLALAHRLAGGGAAIVRNDVVAAARERILIVTGANQGGKTTFARTVGQLHHLAALGLPVPGRSARVPLCDRLLTHFPARERVEDLRGRLESELVRLRDILEQASPDSVVILNELFGATKVRDATVLGGDLLGRVERLGARCVFVTFLDELATPAPGRVSLVATVDPDDPSHRTFEVVRRAAEGRAHALAIAQKYGLTYNELLRRIDR